MADTAIPSENALLELRDLSVDFTQAGQVTHAVRSVSLRIDRGETVGLVGESGSGKSVTALSILQLLRKVATYPGGEILLRNPDVGPPVDLMSAPEPQLQHIRGGRIAMIFQEPMTSLNPLHTVEKQILETLRLHKNMRGKRARDRVLELLNKVGIRDPGQRLTAYPHELSGGQRQRATIAMALANEPELLIADRKSVV